MWNAALPHELLKQAIRQSVREAPQSFVSLIRLLPQLRGIEDFAMCSGLVLWRGLSREGLTAFQALHAERSIFFWLCPPSVYSRSDDAPFMRLMSRSHREGEQSWLPTLIFNRPPTTAESRKAVRDYVAELTQTSIAAS